MDCGETPAHDGFDQLSLAWAVLRLLRGARHLGASQPESTGAAAYQYTENTDGFRVMDLGSASW